MRPRPCLAVLIAGLSLPASASAATTLGSSLASAPDGAVGSCMTAGPCTSMLEQIGGVDEAAPVDGVVVGWAVRPSVPDDGVALRIMHPTDATHYTPSTTSAAVDLAGTGAIERFGARLAIRTGDHLAVRGGDDEVVPVFPSSSPPASANLQFDDPFADGATGRVADASGSAEELLQATIEPDADGDGFGDETQDACPLDPADHTTACVADLAVDPPPTSGPLTFFVGDPAAATFTVTNHGPAGAANTILTLTPTPGAALLFNATTTAGTCTAGAIVTCTLGTLDAGATVSVRVAVPGNQGFVRIAAHVSSDATDPHPDNDTTLGIGFAAPKVVPGLAPTVPPPPPPRPCSVSKRGTGASETLTGTVFGDRISGLSGRDLIHGDAGDDCLYGGLGDDVLFGDAGSDRLYGQNGNDRLLGGPGNDTLSGGNGSDELFGEAGNDTMTGSAGDDGLTGGAGNDTISPGPGHDRVNAGPGNDTINAVDHTRDVIDCGPGSDTATVDRIDHVTHCEHVHRH